jgi:hypothetical protein
MKYITPLIVLSYFIFGTPISDFSNFVWPNSPAPWEQVDAFYYPSRSNLTAHQEAYDVKSLDGCRAWVATQARSQDDPRLSRGDYECAIGKIKDFGGLTVYRITTR